MLPSSSVRNLQMPRRLLRLRTGWSNASGPALAKLAGDPSVNAA